MSFLDNLNLFSSFSQQERENLSLFCQERYLQTGEVLFEEGDDANAMYLLVKGKIQIYKNIGIDKKILGEVKAEEILGEMAIFGGKDKRTASAEALEDSVLITILSFSIKELANKHPELMGKITEIIKQRQEESNLKK